MPTTGQLLRNSATGDTYMFVETAASTGGARVTLHARLRTVGALVPAHLHAFQDETIEVLAGTLTVVHHGQPRRLGAGECLTLPRNAAHNHYNAGPEPVTYRHTVSPALDFDLLFETLIGLAADGKAPNGQYGLLQELVGMRYLDSKYYLASLPRGVQQALAAVVGPLARCLGYRAVYTKYSGIEK